MERMECILHNAFKNRNINYFILKLVGLEYSIALFCLVIHQELRDIPSIGAGKTKPTWLEMSIAACQVSTVIIDLHLRLGNLQNCLQLLYVVEQRGREEKGQNKQTKTKNEPRNFMYVEHRNVKFGFVKDKRNISIYSTHSANV